MDFGNPEEEAATWMASQQPDVLHSAEQQLEEAGINPGTEISAEELELVTQTPVQCREGALPEEEKERQRRNLQQLDELERYAADAGLVDDPVLDADAGLEAAEPAFDEEEQALRSTPTEEAEMSDTVDDLSNLLGPAPRPQLQS